MKNYYKLMNKYQKGGQFVKVKKPNGKVKEYNTSSSRYKRLHPKLMPLDSEGLPVHYTGDFNITTEAPEWLKRQRADEAAYKYLNSPEGQRSMYRNLGRNIGSSVPKIAGATALGFGELGNVPLSLIGEAVSGRHDYKQAIPNINRAMEQAGMTGMSTAPDQITPGSALFPNNPYAQLLVDLPVDIATGSAINKYGSKLATRLVKGNSNLNNLPIPNFKKLERLNQPDIKTKKIFNIDNTTDELLSKDIKPLTALELEHYYKPFLEENFDKDVVISKIYDYKNQYPDLDDRHIQYLVLKDPEIIKYSNKKNPISLDENYLENLDKLNKMDVYLEKDIDKLNWWRDRENRFFLGEDYDESISNNLTQSDLKNLTLRDYYNTIGKVPEQELNTNFDVLESLAQDRYSKGYDDVMNHYLRFSKGPASGIKKEKYRDNKNRYMTRFTEMNSVYNAYNQLPNVMKKGIKEDIDFLKNAIQKNKFKKETELYRNSNYKALVKQKDGTLVQKNFPFELEEGDEVLEKGFQSTSTVGAGSDYVIRAPGGGKQSFLYFNSNPQSSKFNTESEALLPPGLKLKHTGEYKAPNSEYKYPMPIFEITNPYMKTGIIGTGAAGAYGLSQQPRQEYQKGGYIPTIKDAGEITNGPIGKAWKPNWKKMRDQAKKLNAKVVKTDKGSIIYFNDDWSIKGVDDSNVNNYQKGGYYRSYKQPMYNRQAGGRVTPEVEVIGEAPEWLREKRRKELEQLNNSPFMYPRQFSSVPGHGVKQTQQIEYPEYKPYYPKVDNGNQQYNEVVEPTPQMIELEKKRQVPFNHTAVWNALEIGEPFGVASYPDVWEAWSDGKFTYSDITEPLGALPGIKYLKPLFKAGMKGDKIIPKYLPQILNSFKYIDAADDIYNDQIKNTDYDFFNKVKYQQGGYMDYKQPMYNRQAEIFTTPYIEKNTDKEFVQRIVNPNKVKAIRYPNSETATHRMISVDYSAMPSIRNENGELIDYSGDNASVVEAINKNYNQGEYVDLPNPTLANKFAKEYRSFWGQDTQPTRFKYQKGGSTCHKCGGYTKMQTGGKACGCNKMNNKRKMCKGGVISQFDVIDELDILPLNDSRRFATKDNSNPVGFKYSMMKINKM